MTSSFFIFFAFGFFTFVKPAVILIDQVEISGHENQCYDKDMKVFYNQGEVMKNDGEECAETKCLGLLKETGKLRVEILTCPKLEPGPNYTTIHDPNKPYPECCPQLVSLLPLQPAVTCEPATLQKE